MRNAIILMKLFIFTFSFFFIAPELKAQPVIWEPSRGHTQVQIWPGDAPDLQDVPGSEYMKISGELIGGKHVIGVYNVTKPTMTLYQPTVKASGVAIIVIPGGGFEMLAMDLEGTEVCDWLNSKGFACVLLKYRVPSPPYDWHCKCRPDNLRVTQQSLEDVQRTIGLVRLHAKEWNIDPKKIGVLGFSAGGYLVAEISNIFSNRLYKPIDEADKKNCRPDFAVAIYPGHLVANKETLKLNKNLKLTKETPPTFLVMAEDDKVDEVEQSLSYYIALKGAGVPVEMHLFAKGGHAFGLRHTQLPIANWPDLVVRWMNTIGVTSN